MTMSQTPKQGPGGDAAEHRPPQAPSFATDRVDAERDVPATMPAVDDQPPTQVRIAVAGAGRPAAAARRAVVEHCRDRVPETVIQDLRIIVSELVANVLEHGGGPEGLAIDLVIRAGDVDIQVTGHGDRRLLPPASAWDLPPADQPTGRGLALVRCLSGEVEVAGDHPSVDDVGRVTITASVPLTAA